MPKGGSGWLRESIIARTRTVALKVTVSLFLRTLIRMARPTALMSLSRILNYSLLLVSACLVIRLWWPNLHTLLSIRMSTATSSSTQRWTSARTDSADLMAEITIIVSTPWSADRTASGTSTKETAGPNSNPMTVMSFLLVANTMAEKTQWLIHLVSRAKRVRMATFGSAASLPR